MITRRNSLRRSLLAALGLGTLVMALPAHSADEPLVIYNAQHVSLTRAWTEAFTRETGIKTIVRDGGDYEIANQIIQEGAASPADIFLTENSPAMALVDKSKLLAPLDPATLAQVPAAFRPDNGHWTGIAARSTVFAYRKTKLPREALPKSIMDLADPVWKGRIGAAPAGADFQADKHVGDDGEGLSAGERRRVALARALVRIRLGGARFLILDEPTAGLDADTEAHVIDAVRATGAGVLVVSHRPAVLAAADRVVEVVPA